MKYQKKIDLIKKYVKKPIHTLVVGGGFGKEIEKLIKLNSIITSVDPIYIKKPHPKRGLQSLVFIPKKLEDFTSINDSFDYIVAMNSLHFVKNLNKEAKKLQGLLRKNGILVSRFYLMNNKGKLDYKYIEKAFNNMKVIYKNEYWTWNEPHEGTPYKHAHYIIDFVAHKV